MSTVKSQSWAPSSIHNSFNPPAVPAKKKRKKTRALFWNRRTNNTQKGHNNIVKEDSGYVLIPTLPAAIRFLPTITSTIPATLTPRFTDSTRLHQNNATQFNPTQPNK